MTDKRIRQELLLALCACLIVGACGGDAYVRDGAGDGDTFVLSNVALESVDPVTRSWVRYSLTRSSCQLRSGSANPARSSTFNCEITARRHLLDEWAEQSAENPFATDSYLEKLSTVQQAGFLSEYVVRFFRQEHWQLPADLRTFEFRQWSVEHLMGHDPETWMTGEWSFAE